MSKKHPVIAITGSSGAGTTTVKNAFQHIFRRLNLKAAVVEGDSFHLHERIKMRELIEQAEKENSHFSHFSLEANLLKELEQLFKTYGETGGGKSRYYIHNADESRRLAELLRLPESRQLGGYEPGTFTPWADIEPGTDLMFYEGLHGAVKAEAEGINIPQYADLKVGVVPIVNLEWIQKIHRDTEQRGYKPEAVTDTILRRMHDYVKIITPQFSRTDINFQRVPTVDTSNPFISRDIPTADESFVIIRFREPERFNPDFLYLLAMIQNSFMSRRNSIVVPGGKMGLAMELIFMPIIEKMMSERG